MGVEHSTQKGAKPLISFADYYSELSPNGDIREATRIMLDIPRGFDFVKHGAKLLRDIQSAMNLFHNSEVPE